MHERRHKSLRANTRLKQQARMVMRDKYANKQQTQTTDCIPLAPPPLPPLQTDSHHQAIHRDDCQVGEMTSEPLGLIAQGRALDIDPRYLHNDARGS
jgi:hypothetical protein